MPSPGPRSRCVEARGKRVAAQGCCGARGRAGARQTREGRGPRRRRERDAGCGATQRGDANGGSGRGRVGSTTHRSHGSKALRTRGASGSLLRLRCACEALKESGCKGGGGSARLRSRSWWEFFCKGPIVRRQRLTEIQLEKWRRIKKRKKRKIFSVTCALQKQPLSRSVPGGATAALGASGLC